MGSDHQRGHCYPTDSEPVARGRHVTSSVTIHGGGSHASPCGSVCLSCSWPRAGCSAPAGGSVSAQSAGPFRGEYYNNTTLSGAPVLVRDDHTVSFDWGAGSPGPGVNSDNFSVRWTAFVHFDAATYTFRVTTDDGARLWVDDQLIIDQWQPQVATTHTASKYLSAGYHSIRLEYYEGQRRRHSAGMGWAGAARSPSGRASTITTPRSVAALRWCATMRPSTLTGVPAPFRRHQQ